MYAEFKTGSDSDNRIINKLGHLYLFTDYYERTWKLDLNLDSFEVMHGLSRVVLLLPEKIATAIEVNKENFPDPNDDGGFLIQLVLNLVKFYKIRLSSWACRLQLGDNDDIIVSRLEELGNETEETFRYKKISDIVEQYLLIIQDDFTFFEQNFLNYFLTKPSGQKRILTLSNITFLNHSFNNSLIT